MADLAHWAEKYGEAIVDLTPEDRRDDLRKILARPPDDPDKHTEWIMEMLHLIPGIRGKAMKALFRTLLTMDRIRHGVGEN